MGFTLKFPVLQRHQNDNLEEDKCLVLVFFLYFFHLILQINH